MKKMTICMAVLYLVASVTFGQTGGKVEGWGEYVVGVNAQEEYQSVSAGLHHTLALREDGSIVAWGYQTDYEDSYSPVCKIPGVNSNFIAVAAGGYHSVGLKSDGSIVAWGHPGYTDVPLPNTEYTAVDAALYHSIALRLDGSIISWGGGGPVTSSPPGNNTNFVAISAGRTHNLALKDDGSIVAWGSNEYGQLNVPGTGGTPGTNTDFTAVAAGHSFSIGLKSDGSLQIWGGQYAYHRFLPSPNSGFVAIDAASSGMGLRAEGTIWGVYIPDDVENKDFISISLGSFPRGGVRSDGSIVVWGDGQYGNDNIPSLNAGFVKVAARVRHFHALKSDGTVEDWGFYAYSPPADARLIDIAAGDRHLIGIYTNGVLGAWGENDLGQCDIPASTNRFISVAAGHKYGLALDSEGHIVGWGSNLDGELNVPAPNADYIGVAAGALHSVGLRSDGSLALWGNNSYGQASAPETNSGFTAIACGYYHTLALRENGSIEAFGLNSAGDFEIPLPNSGFVSINAGGFSSAAIRSNGTLVVWGRNDYDQLDVPDGGLDTLDIALTATSVLVIRQNAVHVNSSAAPGGDGKNWTTAYQYLQDALSAASAGARIYMAEGSYKPDEGVGITDNDRNATFLLRKGVSILGGFPATGNPGLADRDPDAYTTVLSGDIDGNDTPNFANRTGNSLHVLTASGTDWNSVLDGFTVYGGYDASGGGGGLSCIDGTPTIRNCVFEQNHGGNGGAIKNAGNSPINVESCLFTGNRAGYGGGAIHNSQEGADAMIIDCLFDQNTAVYGGAVYNVSANPTFSGCTFSQNISEYSGGAVYSTGSSELSISSCIFDENEALGGGAIFQANGCVGIASNCVFTGNQAGSGGGGVTYQNGSFEFTGCGFYGNLSAANGGVISSAGASAEVCLVNSVASGNTATHGGFAAILYGYGEVVNCSFSSNSATYGGALYIHESGASALLNNMVSWGNSATYGPEINIMSSTIITLTNCLLQGGLAGIYDTGGILNDGGGNLEADPLFLDPDGTDNVLGTMDDDLRLSTNSPAIDAGNNSAVPVEITTDLASLPRIMDGDVNGSVLVDIGAYEFRGNPDLDDDDLPDWWEQQIIDDDPNDSINSIEDVSRTGNYDNDGLLNYLEYDYGTDPTNPDSDEDGLSDGDEVYSYGSSPTASNSDGDQFDDGIEIAHSMNPNVDDSALFSYVTGVVSNSPEEMAAAGLYTESAIRNLFVGVPLLQVDLPAQQVAIDLQLEWSNSLSNGTWQVYDLGTPDWTRTDQGWLHNAVSNHCFYRIFMNEE